MKESTELFTILNLSMFSSAKIVCYVYIWSFLLPFFCRVHHFIIVYWEK